MNVAESWNSSLVAASIVLRLICTINICSETTVGILISIIFYAQSMHFNLIPTSVRELKFSELCATLFNSRLMSFGTPCVFGEWRIQCILLYSSLGTGVFNFVLRALIAILIIRSIVICRFNRPRVSIVSIIFNAAIYFINAVLLSMIRRNLYSLNKLLIIYLGKYGFVLEAPRKWVLMWRSDWVLLI